MVVILRKHFCFHYSQQILIHTLSILNFTTLSQSPIPPASSVLGILQARILEWGTIPFSKGFSPARNQTRVSYTGGGFFTV